MHACVRHIQKKGVKMKLHFLIGFSFGSSTHRHKMHTVKETKEMTVLPAPTEKSDSLCV